MWTRGKFRLISGHTLMIWLAGGCHKVRHMLGWRQFNMDNQNCIRLLPKTKTGTETTYLRNPLIRHKKNILQGVGWSHKTDNRVLRSVEDSLASHQQKHGKCWNTNLRFWRPCTVSMRLQDRFNVLSCGNPSRPSMMVI